MELQLSLLDLSYDQIIVGLDQEILQFRLTFRLRRCLGVPKGSDLGLDRLLSCLNASYSWMTSS